MYFVLNCVVFGFSVIILRDIISPDFILSCILVLEARVIEALQTHTKCHVGVELYTEWYWFALCLIIYFSYVSLIILFMLLVVMLDTIKEATIFYFKPLLYSWMSYLFSISHFALANCQFSHNRGPCNITIECSCSKIRFNWVNSHKINN